MHEFFANPIVVAALGGALAAARTDFEAFRKWQTHQEALAYNWGTALWRWFQGAVIGAVTGAGLNALVG